MLAGGVVHLGEIDVDFEECGVLPQDAVGVLGTSE
jgi:hypothetical protein